MAGLPAENGDTNERDGRGGGEGGRRGDAEGCSARTTPVGSGRDGGVDTGRGVQGGNRVAAWERGQGGGEGDKRAGMRVYKEITAAGGERDSGVGRHHAQRR